MLPMGAVHCSCFVSYIRPCDNVISAAEAGHSECVKHYSTLITDKDIKQKILNTAIIKATDKGYTSTVKMLLLLGSDVDSLVFVDYVRGHKHTPLILSAMKVRHEDTNNIFIGLCNDIMPDHAYIAI